MKICYISNLYPPHVRGGAERIVHRLANEAVMHGHDAHVITSAPWREVQFSEIETREHRVHVHRIFHWTFFFNLDSGQQPAWLRILNLSWSCKNFLFAWRVYKILRRVRPDIVHTHNLAGTSFLIPLVIKMLHIKHIHTLHDIQLAVASGRMCVGEELDWIHHGWLARAFQFWQCAIWASPAIVTAPSEWLLKFYKSRNYFPDSRLELVRHYFGAPVAATTEFPHAHIAREKFTYLFVGQLERAKGVLMLITLFNELYSRGDLPEAELVVVGTGADHKSAELLAASCPAIHVVGDMDSSRVAHMMRVADIVVVPSLLYENSPTVVVEALALGRPVSVSDVGGAAELVKNYDGGFAVAPNEAAWREHLVWLFNHQQSVVQKIPLLQIPNAVKHFEQLYERA